LAAQSIGDHIGATFQAFGRPVAALQQAACATFLAQSGRISRDAVEASLKHAREVDAPGRPTA